MDQPITDAESKDAILSGQARELVQLWHEEAEEVARDCAVLASKRGYPKGAAEWERIAVLSAQWWRATMAGYD